MPKLDSSFSHFGLHIILLNLYCDIQFRNGRGTWIENSTVFLFVSHRAHRAVIHTRLLCHYRTTLVVFFLLLRFLMTDPPSSTNSEYNDALSVIKCDILVSEIVCELHVTYDG